MAAAARLALERDWEKGPRDAAKALKRPETAPLHYEALRQAQHEANAHVVRPPGGKRIFC